MTVYNVTFQRAFMVILMITENLLYHTVKGQQCYVLHSKVVKHLSLSHLMSRVVAPQRLHVGWVYHCKSLWNWPSQSLMMCKLIFTLQFIFFVLFTLVSTLFVIIALMIKWFNQDLTFWIQNTTTAPTHNCQDRKEYQTINSKAISTSMAVSSTHCWLLLLASIGLWMRRNST